MEGTGEIVVSEPRWVWPTVWVVFPLVGAAALVGLVHAADWLAQLPLVPGWIALATRLPQPVGTVAAGLLGLLAGAAVAYHGQRDSLVVRVAWHEIVLRRGERNGSVPRNHVGAVFVDGKDLVVLTRAGEEISRWPNDRPVAELARAFTAHRYPWYGDTDPYHDQYQRWVPGLPGLPPGADALMVARRSALENNDTHDAAQLRTELARLGLVVRDEDARQFWRMVRKADGDE